MVSSDYVAGIIDGEGNISIIRHSNGKYTPMLRISNTNLAVLEAVAAWASNGTRPVVMKGKDMANRRSCYILSMYGTNLVRILDDVKEKLIVRKEQANAVLEFARTKEPAMRESLACFVSWLNQGEP